MKLLEELQRLESGEFALNGCAIKRWFAQQPDGQKIEDSINTIVKNKLASTHRTYMSIKENAIANGLPVPFSLTSFKYHLSGHCSCQKSA
jgi:hypothetical protein